MKKKQKLAKAKRITLQQKKRTSRRKRLYEVLSTPRPLPVYRCPVSAQIDREGLEYLRKNAKLSAEAPKGTPICTSEDLPYGLMPPLPPLRMAADQQIRSQLHKSEYTIHVDTAAPGTTDHSATGELTAIPDIHQNHRFTGFYYALRSQEVPPVVDNLSYIRKDF